MMRLSELPLTGTLACGDSTARMKKWARVLRRGIVCGVFLCLVADANGGYAISPEDSYAQAVNALVRAHEQALPRLLAPAEATARALIAGGSFYLGGDPGWVAEGDGRAGGLMMVRPLPTEQLTAADRSQPAAPAPSAPLSASALPEKGDVVWIAYSPADYAENAAKAVELEKRGCTVVLFGPTLADSPPHTRYWIDSLTTAFDKPNLTLMGNIISLWTLTAEVTAATSRRSKTLAFYESNSIEGAQVRNSLYEKMRFHDGVPSMSAIPAGELSRQYIEFVQTMLHAIDSQERTKIDQAAMETKQRSAAGHPTVLMVVGHMIPAAVDQHSTLFHYMSFPAQRNDLEACLPQHGYFILIGYVGVYLDLWRQVRQGDATAVWIASPLPTAVDFNQWNDVVLNEHWEIGDSAVTVPGYDVRILPPSGIAQLYIYEMLMQAASQ